MDLLKEIDILKKQKSNLGHLLKKMSSRNQRLEAENTSLRQMLNALVEAIENDGYEGYLFQPVRDALEAVKDKLK